MINQQDEKKIQHRIEQIDEIGVEDTIEMVAVNR